MYINKEQLINLSAIPGIGATRIRSLVAHFKSTELIFSASIKQLCEVDGIELKIAQHIKAYRDFEFGAKQLDRAAKMGIEMIDFWDDRYPENLKRIYDPPAFIFMKGSLQKTDRYAIAMVGTRLPSSYGKLVAEKIAVELAQKGLVIVSGLARGIDTISHEAALRVGGRTLAVMGCGLDYIYPPENKKLADKIIEQGALVSEFPLGTKPDAVNFPRRNRIVSGLSLGTVVVEAGTKSGALLTANYALEQSREVFAVPGNINSPKSAGTNQLIKDGAKLITDSKDILIELEPQLKKFLKEEEMRAKELPADLSDLEKLLLSRLSHEPIHIDLLSAAIGKSTAETLSALLPLEFRDLVKQLPGKLFVRL
ncbi:MAG: DNA-processing protein DprA [candidate division KSB1 bacterium]|nr:DNA-processing protein DprA [candidate division KSB1 bacterium]MDZ7335603.1 DNA-processing protein DprA [candidate division KSB1 bacterium]MDZ7357573.1 DNA-processing protein DprA [candidate division KSB1 bacterium]MDZ7376871.1 DNA-processing protein DprA [candidate division KSB1 bacterium]MDZ7399770.1 DNA-processing protein DprA [candidate division KSB1 bacterium]